MKFYPFAYPHVTGMVTKSEDIGAPVVSRMTFEDGAEFTGEGTNTYTAMCAAYETALSAGHPMARQAYVAFVDRMSEVALSFSFEYW